MNKYLRTIKLQDGKADVYAVLDAFEVKSHALGHAVKKLLCAGQRGHKDYRTDLVEAIQAIEREVGEAKPTVFGNTFLCPTCRCIGDHCTCNKAVGMLPSCPVCGHGPRECLCKKVHPLGGPVNAEGASVSCNCGCLACAKCYPEAT